MIEIFEEKDLPFNDLATIGLFRDNELTLDEDDLRALLSGRRTGMLRLENLQAEGIHIPALDAKISLKAVAGGKTELLLHPIYREAIYPDWLTAAEAEKLEKGEAANIEKKVTGKDGKTRDLLVEYDADTNEFIVTDTDNVIAPEEVNDQPLTAEQKEKFRKGKEVEMEDGTILRYAAAESKGIRSNRLALIASILVDGGVSYLLYHGLHALFGEKRDQRTAETKSDSFLRAQQQMEAAEQRRGAAENKNDYSRGYSRSGTAR